MTDPRQRVSSASGDVDFGVYFDPTKTTSGQRFFAGLCRALAGEARPLAERPRAILFNVSAPFTTILAARLAGQAIVLRIDGLYFDRLSPGFIATFSWPLRWLLRLGLRFPRWHDALAGLANLVNQNYTAFLRILLADRVVYQSQFSRRVHERYFPRKRADVIVNGARYSAGDERPADGSIRLLTIFDEWKPAKRVSDLCEFVEWARESRGVPLTLTILGYTGKVPAGTSERAKAIIESASYVRRLPRFGEFEGEVRTALLDSDIYMTFTYRDPCPNVVVEAMAHGLPVVAMTSGGVEDIVRDAGALVPADDFATGFFSDHRFGNGFPPVDRELVLQAVQRVMPALREFRARVERRFAEELDLDVVAERYARVLRGAARRG
jgi:glycosyltransferase involved in cell wall biosynthesis